jgi:hypothetical protein
MELLYPLLFIIIVGLTLAWLPSFLTLRPKYKYYKLTYLALKNKEYILSTNDESFITFKPKDKVMATTGKFGFNQWQFDDDEILYFKQGGDIKLIKEYIHTRSAPFFDPYTQYWYKKIKKEILLNTRTIAQIREDKLKQLLK